MDDCPLSYVLSGCSNMVIRSEGDSAIPFELTLNSDHQV